MPSKSHKAASRQAKLNRRKRRGKGGAQEFDAGPTAESMEEASASAPSQAQRPQPEPVVEAVAAPEQPVSRSVRRSRQRAPVQPALAYPHLGTELRHIGVLAALIGVILAVLTVFLRG